MEIRVQRVEEYNKKRHLAQIIVCIVHKRFGRNIYIDIIAQLTAILGKLRLPLRLKGRLKINETVFQTTFLLTSFSLSILGHHLTFTTHTVCRINPFLRGFHLILQTFNPFLIAGVVSLVAITDLFALFQIFLCLSQFVLR